MRHILGLDGMRVMSNVQNARSLPSIGSMVKSRTRHSPPGLGNWDNSCYQNSILQGLASLQSLPGYLDQGISTETSESTRMALRDLLSRLNDESNAGMMFWTPPILKSMSSWQQQDAQEYFSKVLDEIEKETSKSAVKPSRNDGLASLTALSESLPSEDLELSPHSLTAKKDRHPFSARVSILPDEISSMMIRNPLEGLIAQRVGCLQCGYVEGLSLTPFTCLTVPLGRQSVYDIRSCLDEYTVLESIRGVECAKCTLLQTRQQVERLLTQFRDHKVNNPAGQLPQALHDSLRERLDAVNSALEKEDFSDNTLSKKCQIGSKNRVSTTKTRQAVIARAPKSLAVHINRSLFDEFTGAQTKNFADIRFPYNLDLGSWCLGQGTSQDPQKEITEEWTVDPAESMLRPHSEDETTHLRMDYELRAVVTHYGRHENGHYICYRKYPSSQSIESDEPYNSWWRLSDEDVSQVNEEVVSSQGGVFMLFYEKIHPLLAQDYPLENAANNFEQLPQAISQSSGTDEAIEVIEDARTSHIAAVEAPQNLAVSKPVLPSVDGASVAQSRLSEDDNANPDAGWEISKSKNESKDASPITTKHRGTENPSDQSEQPLTEPISDIDIAEHGQPSSQSACEMPDSQSLTFEVGLTKENRKVTPTMRTASPRVSRKGSSRGNKCMGQVSSMVTAISGLEIEDWTS